MNLKHGRTHTPEFHAYNAAKQRCTNPNNSAYPDYGGRGIKFLFTSFEQFFKHIGPRPTPKHRLDRENNDGNYEVGNVRWVLPPVNSANCRTPKTNTSGYRGVHFMVNRSAWQAQISVHGKNQHLGFFPSAIAAAKAYDAAAIQLRGKNTRLNFPKAVSL